jgi:hypothetical protein
MGLHLRSEDKQLAGVRLGDFERVAQRFAAKAW